MNKEFMVYSLTPEGIEKAKVIAEKFDAFLDDLYFLVSPLMLDDNVNAREIAIMRTKLEEASFFAKKAMAMANAIAFIPENP